MTNKHGKMYYARKKEAYRIHFLNSLYQYFKHELKSCNIQALKMLHFL